MQLLPPFAPNWPYTRFCPVLSEAIGSHSPSIVNEMDKDQDTPPEIKTMNIIIVIIWML